MPEFIVDEAKDYPKILPSEDKQYELKTEYVKGWGGYYLKHYWKASKSNEWITKEDAHFIWDLADGDSRGYQKVKWDGYTLLFTPYSNYDDIVLRDIPYNIIENKDRILPEDRETEEI